MTGSSTYLTVAEVAARYAVSADTVRRWIKQGEVEAINVGQGKRPTYRIASESLGSLFWRPAGRPEISKVKFQFMK